MRKPVAPAALDKRAQAKLWQSVCGARAVAEKAYTRLGRSVRLQRDREKDAEQAKTAMLAALYEYFKSHGLTALDIQRLSRLAFDEMGTLGTGRTANACNTDVLKKA